ncbi:MAG: hypothetical protein QM811_13805 [Pirellulales bacterium]
MPTRTLNQRLTDWFAPSAPWGVTPRGLAIWMCAATFLVFAAHGAWPTPDSNEANYLGKAKHYWNPEWCGQDFYFQSADAHPVFYWTFGWLTLLMPLPAVAWIGRIAVWIGLAIGWQRLSSQLLRRIEFGPLAAATFVLLAERCHMAGEWVVGGIEGKSIAFVFIFFGLAELAAGRWTRVFPLFGAAAAFHVLVGGWAVVAALAAWTVVGRKQIGFVRLLPYLIIGGVLASPSVWYGLRLTRNVDPTIVAEANFLYVVERLPHHLWPERFQALIPRHIAVMATTAVLCGVLTGFPWTYFRRKPDAETSIDRLNPGGWRAIAVFFCAAAGIALIGMALPILLKDRPEQLHALMRYYWFRASDAYTPLVCALAAWRCLELLMDWNPSLAVTPLLGMGVLLVWDLGEQIPHWPFDVPGIHAARVDSRPDAVAGKKDFDPADWRATCAWISANTPESAVFLTPRGNKTFKWYAKRAEVVTVKDFPQDAVGIQNWWARLNVLHANPDKSSPRRWLRSPAEKGLDELRRLAGDYGAEYVLIQYLDEVPELPLTPLYRQGNFAVYRLAPVKQAEL